MKDEELFKAWKSEQYKDQSTEERFEFVEHLHNFPKHFETTFLAGLIASRPQWHDPEETIDKDKVVLGHIKLCNKDRYSLVQWNGEWWYQYGTFNAEVRLIAWCEIPTFDKE